MSGITRTARHGLATLLTAMLVAGCAKPPPVAVPDGYPASYADTIRAGEREGRLVIWSAIDRAKASALLDDYRRRHPAIQVVYEEIPARQLTERFLAAVRAGQEAPDILWSSAMDLQIKLVNDGYAQTYVSPEAPHLAGWANWKNQAWGTTAEPIVFVYNRRLIPDTIMPRGHLALARFLETRPPAMRDRVATYDLPTSAVGYLYFSQDQQATHGFWRLVRAMATNGLRTFRNAEEAFADVAAGRSAIGYDIIGSYALGEVQRHPDLGMVLPADYTLVVTRIAVITRVATHPDAAKLFLDHLLSRSGQSRLVEQRMPPVRTDVAPPPGLRAVGIPLRAIRVGPALLVDSDRLTRDSVLRRWRASIAGRQEEGGR